MRECLGWITNCENRQGCPQNWLELSVSEVPVVISCHVCEGEVHLVGSEDDLTARDAEHALAAFPVVPCTALGGGQQRAATAHVRGNGAAAARAKPAPAEVPKTWYCLLQNGDQIKLDKDTMVIGRSRTCDVVIPSAKVSRQHASLARAGDDYFIEDLGSANGVWLRGEKITRVKVAPGDVFTISDETLTFEQR